MNLNDTVIQLKEAAILGRAAVIHNADDLTKKQFAAHVYKAAKLAGVSVSIRFYDAYGKVSATTKAVTV